LGKGILKSKYPISSNSIEQLEKLIKYDKSEIDEVLS